MTTSSHLTALVGDDGRRFSSSEKSNAISAAQAFLSTSDGDSSAKDMATAMLAQRILINSKKDPDDQQPLTSLMTNDIRALMADDEKDTAYKVIHHNDPDVDWR